MSILLNKPVCQRECDFFPGRLQFCSWAPLRGRFSGMRPGLVQQQGVRVCFPEGNTGDRLQEVKEKARMPTSGWIRSQIPKGLGCQDMRTQDIQCPGVSSDVCSEMMVVVVVGSWKKNCDSGISKCCGQHSLMRYRFKCNIYDEISIIEGIAKIFERNFNKYL